MLETSSRCSVKNQWWDEITRGAQIPRRTSRLDVAAQGCYASRASNGSAEGETASDLGIVAVATDSGTVRGWLVLRRLRSLRHETTKEGNQ
jgi:hypothetical protein